MRRIPVRLGNRSYSIHIAAGLMDQVGREIRSSCDGNHVLLVSDSTVHPLYGPRVERSLRERSFRVSRFLIEPGESEKNLATVKRIYGALLAAKADRHTIVVALGGGVVGDTAGFAAATWHRGAPLVQVPTTILAQVDSSIGGKTGVNLPAGKNLIGAFHQPAVVCIDPGCLATLPEREYRAGFGEVVKYGMIRDGRFFRRIEKAADALLARHPEELARVVAHCCRLKAEYVAADESDRGGTRTHLNYGHTFGHAVEAATRYRAYRHGEAVAVGMAAASRVSLELGLMTREDRGRLLDLLGRFGLPTSGIRAAPRELLAWLARDKKAREGRLRIVLTKGIGLATVCESVPEPLLFRAFDEVCVRFPERRVRKVPRS